MEVLMRVILETTRLVLREMAPEDMDFVAALLGDPEVMQFWPKALTREEAEKWIGRQCERYKEHGFGYWLALEKRSGIPVGQIGLMPMQIDGIQEVGLGYILARPFWGRGLATEGAAGALDFAFNVLGKQRVVAPIRPANLLSLRVAERLGMEIEKTTTFADLEHLLLVTSNTGWRQRKAAAFEERSPAN
jgi:RimJ/RimL family protein N-acetyltransferase